MFTTQTPSQCDLSHSQPSLLCNFLHALIDRLPRFIGKMKISSFVVGVGLDPKGLFRFPWSSKETSAERGPGYASHAKELFVSLVPL